MAYIADFITKSTSTKATTLVFAAADFPPHVTDEYLVLGVTIEAEVAMTITPTAGWTQIGTTVGNPATATGLYSAMFYKKCASAAEACTFTFNVTTAAHAHAFLIRDADLTTFLDGTPAAATFATASQFTSASITTTSDDTLLLHYIGIDSTTTTPTMCHSAPGPVHFLDSSDNGGTNVTAGSKTMAGACAGWYMQRAPGATPQPSWNASLTAIRNEFVVGIKHKAGGLIPPYIDDATTIGTKVMDGHWWASATTRNNENFKATPLSVTSFITHLGTLTGTFDAGAQVADSHINPYSNAISSTPAISATALTGFELQIPTTAIDMTTGWLVGAVMESTPKSANWGQGSIKTGGLFIAVGSTTNYRIFQVLACDNLINTEGRAVFSIQVNQTQTQSGQSATPPTVSAINRVWALNRGNIAALVQYHCDYHLIQKITAAGGDSANPVDTEGLYQIGKFLRIKLIQKQGAGGLLAMVPVQIGGGDAVNFQIDAGALQFPRIYDRNTREINYHGANNAIGISYAGKSGDVISHTNSVVTSASPYYWEINAAATSACTWNFSGLVVVTASVTLRPVTTFTKMSFSDCPTVTLNSSTVTTCSFNNSKVVAASLADLALVSGCGFTSNGTGHAVEVSGTASTITLSGNTFTGYAATNGSTGNEAIFVNIATGTVTINIGGGGNTPSIRTAGATVNVVSGATVTFTGLPTGTDIVILTAGTSTILAQVDAHPSSSYAWGYTGTPTVDAGFIKPGYVPYYVRGLALSAVDSSLPISLTVDRNYA